MTPYPKTENLLKRDEGTHKLILGEFRDRSFEQVGQWHVTEKIDGTNIRLCYLPNWTPEHFTVRGRSDEATLPKGFIEEAVPDVDIATMEYALRIIDPDGYATGMIVYGEGYGPGIQKGGGEYAERKTFRAFDVLTLADDRRPLWRPWADVEAVASALDLNTAPVISKDMTTEDVIRFVQDAEPSIVSSIEGSGSKEMEGVVARTDPYLYDSRGSRVKFKLKAHDLT